jgi:hypothetical protein
MAESPKTPTTPENATPTDHHHEGIIERMADEIESRFLQAAQVATGTSSAEVNLATAALEAIEGTPDEPSADPAASPPDAPEARQSSKTP